MAWILHIETATKTCSVTLANKGKLVFKKEATEAHFSHAEQLHPFIEEVLHKQKITTRDLDAIAVSKGPGSYTGLRIGVSAAKGLCFANNIPLIAIETLHSMALSQNIESGYLIPLIDARRMEVYSAVFDAKHQQIRVTKAEVISENSFQEYAPSPLYLFGTGAAKCKEVLQESHVHFITDYTLSATSMVALAYQKYKNEEFEDVAYFEPYYLKDFIATPEKKKL